MNITEEQIEKETNPELKHREARKRIRREIEARGKERRRQRYAAMRGETREREITEDDILPNRPFRGGIKAVRDFDQQHGGSGIEVDGRIIYPDGAFRDPQPEGILADPPSDDFERLSIIVRFWQALTDDAVEEFDSIKRGVEMFSRDSARRYGPSDPDATIAKLERLKAIVEERRERLNAAKAKLENTEKYKERKKREDQESANQSEWSEFQRRVNEIEI